MKRTVSNLQTLFNSVFLIVVVCLLLCPDKLTAQDQRVPVRVRLHGNLLVGLNERDARPSTTPLINRLTRDLDYPFEFEIGEKVTRLKDLEKFGEGLSNGEFQLGIVWGTEFGWLKKRYPNLKLEALVVASVGDDQNHFSSLMVRRSSGVKRDELDKLVGKRIAKYDVAPIAGQLYEKSMQIKLDLQSKPYKTVKDALFAVIDGDEEGADCVAVDVAAFNHFATTCPGAANLLVHVGESKNYPAPALIGIPERLNKLKPGLWQSIGGELRRLDTTEEGRGLIKFWKFEKFEHPSNEYRAMTNGAGIEELFNAAPDR